MDTFFERLVQVAKENGFDTLHRFAVDGLGYPQSVKLSRLKDGNNKPSYDTLLDIATNFNVDLNWLITGEGTSAISSSFENLLGQFLQPLDKRIKELENTSHKHQLRLMRLEKSSKLSNSSSGAA